MLEACGVTVTRGNRCVFDGVDLTVAPGELLAICGPNGSGKSTLLATLAGDLKPLKGKVVLDGAPIHLTEAVNLARVRAVLEQSPNVALPFLVEEVVGLGASCAPQAMVDILPLIRDAMRSTGILDLIGKRMDQLSGGEAARAHLSRVLAQIAAGRLNGGGKYLLLDEPTASLDLSSQIQAMRCIRDTSRAGSGVLVVVHDLNLAATFADRVVILKAGKVAADGAPKDVFREDTLMNVFGVKFKISDYPTEPFGLIPVYHR